MKKLMFATALVASAAAFADAPTALNAISFEGYTAGATFANGATEKGEDGNNKSVGPYFYYDGEQDGSSVKAFGGENAAVPSCTRPNYFATQELTTLNYLDLSTEGGILWRSINPISAEGNDPVVYGLGDPEPVAATGTYLDTLVQFTPTEDGGAPETTPDDKLAIWLNVDSSGASPVTNLMVRAAYYDSYGTPNPTNFVLTGKTVESGEWYRLTIKAVPNIIDQEGAYGSFYNIPAFIIYVDGIEMAAVEAPIGASLAELDGAIASDFASLVAAKKILPSLVPGSSEAPTLSGVGFKGSGALDDIVWTTDDPFPAPATFDFTLTWPSGLTAVGYTLGTGGAIIPVAGTSPATISVADGSLVTFIVANADGAQKVLTATAAEGSVTGIDATGSVFTWADYLGDAVDGAYEIDNLAELELFQKGVANTNELTTVNTTFKLTADIALTNAWPGIGLQNGKDVYSTQQFNDEAFLGTFDGQNYTISGFQMVGGGLDYCGFFNSTYGATIQNLKIQYAGGLFAADTTASSLESGATFVGVAKNSTLRNLTTVAGTVSCSKGFGGIVGYLTSGTLVDSCTNNVNMTSLKPNKCGGIAMITQGGSAVTICNCQNNGSVAGSGEIGSAIGYIGLDVTISNFESTVAYKMFQHQTATVTLQGTIKGDATVDSYTGQATPGLNFATVDGSVATFVSDDALAAGNTYKVMHAAAATYEFTAPGTIAFETALATPSAYNITASGLAGSVTDSTSGTVTTYTAGYFPRTATAGQDGTAANPFEIADVDDLQALQAAVAADAGYRGLSYKQVADINMSSAGPFAGIGTYAAKLTEGVSFTGTYDGQGHKISNIDFTQRNYGGVFNQVKGGTIKNLAVDTITCNTFDASVNEGEWGCSIIGNVGLGATVQNLVAMGSFGSAARPCSHNVAGIAIRVCGGASNVVNGVVMLETLVKDCTNNATLHGFYTKCAGITALTQDQDGVPNDYVLFDGCVNNSSIEMVEATGSTLSKIGRDGLAGILAYVSDGTKMRNCVNAGSSLTSALSTAKIGGLVGWAQGRFLDDLGGNATDSSWKMIGSYDDSYKDGQLSSHCVVSGFQFAVEDNLVATTVQPPLTKNACYLLEGNVAASETAVATLTDPGDYIEFETLYGYTFAGTVAGATATNTTGTVIRYSIAAAGYPTYLTDADAATKALYDTWKVANGADTNSEYENQFLVNTAPATSVPSNALAITAIEQNATAGWDITVECTVQGVDLGGTVGTARVGNGYLAVSYTDNLTGTWTTENIAITASANGKVTVNVNKAGAKFMKVKLSPKLENTNQQ